MKEQLEEYKISWILEKNQVGTPKNLWSPWFLLPWGSIMLPLLKFGRRLGTSMSMSMLQGVVPWRFMAKRKKTHVLKWNLYRIPSLKRRQRVVGWEGPIKYEVRWTGGSLYFDVYRESCLHITYHTSDFLRTSCFFRLDYLSTWAGTWWMGETHRRKPPYLHPYHSHYLHINFLKFLKSLSSSSLQLHILDWDHSTELMATEKRISGKRSKRSQPTFADCWSSRFIQSQSRKLHRGTFLEASSGWARF